MAADLTFCALLRYFIFVWPILISAAGIYLLALSISAEESVQLLGGHVVPKGLAGMLGAVTMFGAVAVSVEAVRRLRAPDTQPSDRTRHERRA